MSRGSITEGGGPRVGDPKAWPMPGSQGPMRHIYRPSMEGIQHHGHKPNTIDHLQFTPPHNYERDDSLTGDVTHDQLESLGDVNSNPTINGSTGASTTNRLTDGLNSRDLAWSVPTKPVASGLRFWDPLSPNFRFFILFLAILVPFGGHVIKYSLSSLQNEMLADSDFELNHTRLGMFQSAVSIPNLFMPLVGGLFLDRRGNATGTIVMLCVCLFGHLGFVLACGAKSFHAAFVSRILFGLGQGSTVVAQGRICAMFFVGRELVFAVALIESAHNLANFIAFIYVVPVSEALGGYIWALWMGVAFSLVSLLAGVVFFHFNCNLQPDEKQIEAVRDQERAALLEEEASHATTSTHQHQYNTFQIPHSPESHPGSRPTSRPDSRNSMASEGSVEVVSTSWCNPWEGLSFGFFLLCLIHMIYSNCYHLFAYISATLISDRFNTGVAKAGWLAGLSNGVAIFLCPLAGLLLDRMGFKMWILVICGSFTVVAYVLLFSASVTPVISLVMLAVVVSFMPTIMKSSVPNLVNPAVYGVAYGIYEIAESLGSVIGNGVIGFFRDRTHSWDLDIEIFAAMAFIATGLACVLIFLDYMEWLGVDSHGHPLGGLNESSFKTGRMSDRLKQQKNRYIYRENRKFRERERSAEPQGEVVARLEPFQPTNKD